MFLNLVCFICAGQHFYTELSNKLEATLRGYKQTSIDSNFCELLVKLTCLLVKVEIFFIFFALIHPTRSYLGL